MDDPVEVPELPGPPLPSPYGMYPSADAALEATQPTPLLAPSLYAFDATKPTIDQTRKDAIDATRNNFAALTGIAGIDPTSYVLKNSGTAYGLTVSHPTTGNAVFVINAPTTTGFAQAVWAQVGTVRFDAYVDPTYFILRGWKDGGAPWNALVVKRDGSGTQIIGNVGVISGFPRVPSYGAIGLDINATGTVILALQSLDNSSMLRAIAANGGVFLDSIHANAAGEPTAGGSPLIIRSSDPTGAIQQRLLFDPQGMITTYQGAGAFSGGYRYLGAFAGGTIDFRQQNTVAGTAGGSVGRIILGAGQVGRILLLGGGPTTLAGTIHVPTGGLVWGTTSTMLSLFSPDGMDGATGQCWASSVPYDN